MKIVLVNAFFSPMGGAEMSVYRIYKLLKKKGHQVEIFTTNKRPFFEENNLKTEYFPSSVDYIDIRGFDKIKLNLIKRHYNIEAKNKFDVFLKEVKPDLVHFNNIKSSLTHSVINACYENRIPSILTLRDASLFCPIETFRLNTKNRVKHCTEELCVAGDYTHCIKNKCRGNSYFKSINAVYGSLFEKTLGLYKKVSCITTPSIDLKRLAINYGIPPEKVIAIPNFVDKTYFEQSIISKNKGYFLYAGRLSEEKGIQYLLEAFSHLPEHINLRIVGTGPYENELKKQADDLNIKNVEFVGFKKGYELINEYRHCIASILPCDWFEAFGLTIVESFCFNKPVIASNVGGIKEIIDHGENGYLTEIGNIEQLKAAIIKLYNNPSLAMEMGQKGRAKAEKFYSEEVFYDNIIELYKKVVNKK